MLEVETLQTENRVVNQILHALADEGFVTIAGEDEEMSETTLHFALINYLYNALKLFLSNSTNCFVASNLRIFYDEKNPLKWYAPDVLVAFGVSGGDRTSYNLATEKTMPQVVFEVASEQTADRDTGEKYLDYARLGVEEYYLLDPERGLLPSALLAFQREDDKLLPIKIANERVFSPRLELEIVNTDSGIRLFDPQAKHYLPSPQEMAQRLAELEASLKKH